MIPRAADVTESLAASRLALKGAAWKVVLGFIGLGLIWIASTNLLIERLALGSWAYSARSLVFVGLTAGAIWLFLRPLTYKAVKTQKLVGDAEKGYRALFESHPAPMWLFERDSRQIVRANEAAIEAYGYSEAEFAQREILDLYTPKERERLRHKATEGKLACADLSGVHQHQDRNGQPLDVEVMCNTLLLSEQPHGQLMARNISVSLQIEKQLRRSLEQLELAQQVARLGYWEYDPQQDRLVCSLEIQGILGLDHKLSKKQYMKSVHPEDRRDLLRSQRKAMNAPQPPHRYRIVRPGGEIRHIAERTHLTRGLDDSSTLFRRLHGHHRSGARRAPAGRPATPL